MQKELTTVFDFIDSLNIKKKIGHSVARWKEKSI